VDTQTRYFLQYGDDVVIPLRESPVTIGRSATCDLVLNDGLISRRHASVSVTDEGVVVEDLGSINGVFVDGHRIPGRWVMHADGWVTIAGHHVRIFRSDKLQVSDRNALTAARHDFTETAESAARASAHAVPERFEEAQGAAEVESYSEATRRGNVIVLLGPVVDKMLAAGQAQEAAALFGARLRAVLADAQRTRRIELESLTPAGQYAVKLAAATGQPEWVDYIFELYLIAVRPPPVEIVDELHNLIRRLPPIKLGALRQLLGVLDQRASQLSASERFALQRLRGLERVAASR
jgi:hypothetical protein